MMKWQFGWIENACVGRNMIADCLQFVSTDVKDQNAFSLIVDYVKVSHTKNMVQDLACSIELWMNAGSWESTKKS